MARYAIPADFLVYGLSAGTISTLDSSMIQAHLDGASDLIDSFMGSKFKLPLITWSTIVTQKCCHIAAWTLLVIRGFDPENPADKAIISQYSEARSWLEGISEGEVTPVVVDSSGTPGQYGGRNTLQLTTQEQSTQMSPQGSLNPVESYSNDVQQWVGPPRSRGWR